MYDPHSILDSTKDLFDGSLRDDLREMAVQIQSMYDLYEPLVRMLARVKGGEADPFKLARAVVVDFDEIEGFVNRYRYRVWPTSEWDTGNAKWKVPENPTLRENIINMRESNNTATSIRVGLPINTAVVMSPIMPGERIFIWSTGASDAHGAIWETDYFNDVKCAPDNP